MFQVSEELLKSLYNADKSPNTLLEAEAFEKAKHEMRTVISECNFDIHNIKDYIQHKGWHQNKVEYFLNLLERHWSELLRAALNHYNSTHGETITNFDWLIKLVLGTSELKTLQYPLLQLILCTVNKTGQQKKVLYDINKDMLLKVINVLESTQ